MGDRMKALLMGYYGAGNLGDEMMLVCLRQWLEAQEVSVTVLSEHPHHVEEDHGLPAVQNWPLLGEWSWRAACLKGGALRVLRTIRRHDALIVGGGDLIRDDLGWRGFFFPMEKVVAALLMRKKVYFVNVGIGRPRTRYGRRLLRWALPRAEQIIVRDQRSIAVCRDCGAETRTTFASDIVVSLRSFLKRDAVAQTDATAVALTKPYVIVSLREAADAFGQFTLSDDRIRTIAAALDEIVARDDCDLIFAPFQTGEIDDGRVHQRVIAYMRQSARAINRPWTTDIPGTCRLFADARGVVAMRLHAAVLAVGFDRPCVVLPYDHKLREFARLGGLPCIEAADLDRAPVNALRASLEARAKGSRTWITDWNSLRLARATPRTQATSRRFVNSRLTKETTS
jgi:polysaccharide pyruvyl transferase CsaB